jgi:hypothetical protein
MKRTKKETDEIIKRSNFLREILKENGLTLSGFDPGVIAFKIAGVNPYSKKQYCVALDFSSTVWEWLEPLLFELRNLRLNKADAERYCKLRKVDPDVELPTVLIHKRDSWGNWKYKVLNGKVLDKAVDKMAK